MPVGGARAVPRWTCPDRSAVAGGVLESVTGGSSDATPGTPLSGWAALLGGFVVTLLTDPPAPAPAGPGAWVITGS